MSRGRAGHRAAGAANRPQPILRSHPAHEAAPRPVVATAFLEAADPKATFAWGDAAEWQVIVAWNGVPCAYPRVVDPGSNTSPDATETLLRRHAAMFAFRQRELDRLRGRLGAARPEAPPLRVSVVMCTRRRPQSAASALIGLSELDRAPHEIIVVDNDPGEQDCRSLVEEHGMRYLRVDRRGLNIARRAGLAAATGDVVAYLDDDCRPPRGWLARLPELFADPTVGAVTGPAFAESLDTPARASRERLMSFVHGLRHERYDWSRLRPARAGAIGAGANMCFRRELMLSLGDVFPDELDLGTSTLGGGDLYAIYCVLAAGRRVVYDPASWLRHAHPADPESLERTGRLWGVGFTSLLTKLVVERRELTAVHEWWWHVRQYAHAVTSSLPWPDPVLLRSRFNQFRFGLGGPAAWLRSRREAAAHDAAAPLPPAMEIRTGAVEEVARVAVIRADSTAARNDAAARCDADLLVFIDEAVDTVPHLARAHRAAHEAARGPAIVGGSVRARPAETLAGQRQALRVDDAAHLRASALALSPGDVDAANLSLPRHLFDRLGGFDPSLSPAAAATDLAARALAQGALIAHAADAQVWRAVPDGLEDMLDEAWRSGADAARLARRNLRLTAAVEPLAGDPLARALRRPAARRGAAKLAAALEWARMRGLWAGLADAAERAARVDGWVAAGGRAVTIPMLRLDLASAEPIARPIAGTPLVDVWIGDRHVGAVRPRGGSWHASLAEQVLDRLAEDDWRELHLRRGRTSPAGGAPPRMAVLESEHWVEIDGAVRATREPLVACLAPGVSGSSDWLRSVHTAFAGDQIGMVVGAGAAAGDPPAPVHTVNRRLHRRRYDVLGLGYQFVAVSRAAYEAAGGFDSDLARRSPHAATADLLERVLDAGYLVAHAHLPGIEPAGSIRPYRSALKWEASKGRGRLLVAKARERGGAAGALWLIGHLVLPHVAEVGGGLRWKFEPSLRHWTGTAAGLLIGAGAELLGGRPRRRRAQAHATD